MRRTLTLVLVALLAAAVPVAAEEAAEVTASIGGSFELSTSSTVDTTNFDKPDNGPGLDFSPKFGLKAEASQGDAWSLDATLVVENELTPYGKASLATSSLKVSVAKDVGNTFQLSRVSDPLSLIVINDPVVFDGADASQVRLESAVAGTNLLVQADSVNGVTAGASVDLAPVTVGAYVRPVIPSSTAGKTNFRLAGYATVDLGLAKVSGAVGATTEAEDDRLAFGAKAELTPIEGLKSSVSYATAQANFPAGFAYGSKDRTLLSASATYSLAPFTITGSFSRETLTSSGVVRQGSMGATVKYAGDPIEASLGVTTRQNRNIEVGAGTATPNPLTSITGSVKFALLPDVATLNLDFVTESDKDGDIGAFAEGASIVELTEITIGDVPYYFDPGSVTWGGNTSKFEETATAGVYKDDIDRYRYWAKSHFKIGGGVEYKLSDRLTVTPAFAYHSYGDISVVLQQYDEANDYFKNTDDKYGDGVDGNVTSLELSLAASYKVSDSASVTAKVGRTAYSLPVFGSNPTSAESTTISLATKISF
ncbi:hypothetical protein [Geochorda subterranea]|uniref:Uncharacterized protein n=1 Tax=Geochorda subterranea TaxID=3109564 RepID=A0ABZ1BMK9_9FIRM|nr:hypothetical protein [Limnochorda sp. LNt]WRP13919.1 hypothetical protein VLY81_10840 [Limnochorda sp. LNt]